METNFTIAEWTEIQLALEDRIAEAEEYQEQWFTERDIYHMKCALAKVRDYYRLECKCKRGEPTGE